MKHKYTLFLYALFLIMIIVYFSWLKSSSVSEGFTSYIRSLYNPQLRKTRLMVGDVMGDAQIYFKKMGRRIGF